MYDALVLLLGFEPGPLIRATAKFSLSKEGRIIILTPEYKDERSERAFLDFQRIVNMIFKGEGIRANIRRYEVTLNPISRGIQRIRRIFQDIRDNSVVIAFTGGMRALCLATFMAYLMTYWGREPEVVVYLEGRGEFVSLPKISRIFEMSITYAKQEIINALSRKPKSITQLAIELNKDRSVLYRHIDALEKRGLVRKVGRLVELTDIGELFVELK